MPTFTQDDVRKLLKAAQEDRLEKAWQLALSGLRRGEVCGLVWDGVAPLVWVTATPPSRCEPTFTPRTMRSVLRPPGWTL